MIARITDAPSAAHVALPQTDALPLWEGSSVLVQVLRSLGGGKYHVAVNGKQLDVSAQKVLKTGSSFSGTVRFEGGRTLIEPRTEELVRRAGADSGNAAALLQKANVPLQDGQLAQYLAALGLPPDSLSARLLSFLRQNGLKVSLQYIDKIRRAARRFAGQEAAAAEAMLLLDADGIACSDEAVRAVLAQFYGTHGGASGGGNAAQDLAREDVLSRLYAAPVQSRAGMLTLLNHCAKENPHWIFLPYEWNGTAGVIRLLLDSSEKKVKKMLVSAGNAVTRRWIVVYYGAKDVSEIRFWTEPRLTESSAHAACDYLSELTGGIPALYSEDAVFSGICVQNEALATAGGLA